MKTKMSKRLLTLVLAIVLTFALGVSAFATWSSFQHNNDNNGTTSSAPTSSSPTKTKVDLNFNSAFSGVDTTPVIQGNYAYILYNGGAVDTSTGAGGARLARVDITSTDPNTATIWDFQLDADANNTQQLSTPYYDAGTNTIYAGVTLDSNVLDGKTFSDWSVTPSTALSGGTLTIPANTTVTLIYSGLHIPGDYNQAYFMTGIMPSGNLSGTVSLYDGEDTYNYGTSYAYPGYEFGLYNNGAMIPAGNYTVTITLTSDEEETTIKPFTCVVSSWRLYKITGLTNSSPTKTLITSGAGQLNTHINTASKQNVQYLYFGIYEGDRCYYQVNTNTNAKLAFKPGDGDDFYWAGAARVGSYMVFGSESGKVYKRPIGDDFDLATGAVIDLTTSISNAGPVRSSVCFDDQTGTANDALYLTTKNGYLWKLDTSLSTASAISLIDSTYVNSCTSTPVVSNNGNIYVGGYKVVTNADWTMSYYGEIYYVPVNNFTQNALTAIWNSSTEAVQSSIVVYSTVDTSSAVQRPIDYLYYTTNGATGRGRCLSFVLNTVTSNTVWTTEDKGTGYTLQGVAVSDSGIVVFGNDDNKLFIVK